MIAYPLLVLALAAPIDDARGALMKGDSTAAAQAYDEVARSGASCADLEYDLGTTSAQAGRVGAGVLHLERALRLAPWDSDARQNLEKIRARRDDKLSANELGDSPWQRVLLGLPGSALAWSAVVLWVIGFLLLTVSSRRLTTRGAKLSIALAVLLGGLGYAGLQAQAVHYGVVLAPTGQGVKVHSGPAADLPSSFEVHEGLKILIEEEANGFTKIRLANGLEGYVPDEAIERI
jgi:hypothetical protein